MKITVLYVGSSLLAPLKSAEREINREYKLDLQVSAYNLGSPLDQGAWNEVERNLGESDVVFVIHVMDGENAARLLQALDRYYGRHHAVIVLNCMPELMRRTRMGRLDVIALSGEGSRTAVGTKTAEEGETGRRGDRAKRKTGQALRLVATVGSWIGHQAQRHRSDHNSNRPRHTQYVKLIDRLPSILRFIPNAGSLRDIKSYLYVFCYFLQPTPANIRSMILYSLKQYVPDKRLQKIRIRVPQPEHLPSLALYHPEAPVLFASFSAYRKWYIGHKRRDGETDLNLDPARTIGLLLMRPQVVSRTTRHYDALVRAIESEGLSVIPALSTLMDNRQACEKFFIEGPESRVSQILSLTGFSFVGGPAMNDSQAASEFLQQLNRPYRSAVSLDTQTIEAWQTSQTGLNPVQAGMQIAIPEIDGATEPFIYGGISQRGVEPVALEDRCRRLARRLRRWNRLRTCPRNELKLALTLFCFPPNKGNIGTAADLDVFPSVLDVLSKLKLDGYNVDVPRSTDELRSLLLGGNSESFGTSANVAYRMTVDEYIRVCPFVDEIEAEWGMAPGTINAFGQTLLIQGITLGSVFIGVQPTFGFEGDPMRLMMARSGAPHHGFMAFYAYLNKVFNADAVIHLGTHGAMEFMPGKQIGLSGECWPDRLIGELPNIYVYSVNNPSEGSIAKRRSYAELISYLTPPIESAGLYKELASLKDLIMDYRQAVNEDERARLFQLIEQSSTAVNLDTKPFCSTGSAAPSPPS